jgi:hypothetical protein
MSVTADVPEVDSWADGLRRTPMVWKIAVVVGVLGWFLVLGSSTTTTSNGVTTCSGTDLGPIVVAAIVAVLGVVGWQRNRNGHPASRLPSHWALGGVALLGVIVVVHLLRVVVDPSGGMC